MLLGCINKENQKFKSNLVKTTQYTYLDFLPKNLYFQLTKSANLYFCIIIALQLIPPFKSGLPTMIPPFSFVMCISMLKDFYENYKRKLSDKAENERGVMVIPF